MRLMLITMLNATNCALWLEYDVPAHSRLTTKHVVARVGDGSALWAYSPNNQVFTVG